MCQCGAVLVKSVDRNGVTTIDDEYIRFQRRTDFVACSSCFRSYPAAEILAMGGPDPQGTAERIESALAAEAEEQNDAG